MSIVLVFGTRPEAIKLGPVAHELRVLGVRPVLLCTGQHTQLLAGTPAETDLANAKSLGLASTGNVTRWLASAEAPLKTALGEYKGGVVVVQGDTMSALAAARAASELGIVLAHVEAGVRSGNEEEPWPEERSRREITGLADWHYAPTSQAFANLVQEGVALTRILVTGNTVVSALARYSEAIPQPAGRGRTIFITLHRRELLLNPELPKTLQALAFACAYEENMNFLWPLHPAMARAVVEEVRWPGNVTFTGPLAYRPCVEGLSRCVGVLTDSGGLQEEAATLGVPCAVLRNVSDRPESIAAGVARLFLPTPSGVELAVQQLAQEKIERRATSVFGTPLAAVEVARALAKLTRED